MHVTKLSREFRKVEWSADFCSLTFSQNKKNKKTYITMPRKDQAGKKQEKSVKLTQGQKKALKNANKAKANPGKAKAKKEKNDRKRAG
tara:strand:+ start:90 stop:353 length:264 start_codon:yes stop_codon:yes gene_type:complete